MLPVERSLCFYNNFWTICVVTLLFNILLINGQWNILYQNSVNFKLSLGNHIGNVPILDNMHTYFDIYISSRPTDGPNNLLQIGDTDSYNTSFDRRPTIYMTEGGSIIFRLSNVNNTDNAIDGSILNTDQWYNVTIIYTQSLWECYVGNVLIGSINNFKPHNPFSSKKVWASGSFITGSYTINANISNILIQGYIDGESSITSWTLHNTPPLPLARCCWMTGFDSITNRIWLLAGTTNNNVGDNIWYYSINNNQFTQTSNKLPNPVYVLAQLYTQIGREIYYLDNDFNRIEKFNMSTGLVDSSWSSIANNSLPIINRRQACLANDGRYIFVIGGGSDDGSMNSPGQETQYYDTINNEWRININLPSPGRGRSACIVTSDKLNIYLFGGQANNNVGMDSILKLDISNKTNIDTISNTMWITINDTLGTNGNNLDSRAVEIGGDIYLISSRQQIRLNIPSSVVTFFDSNTNKVRFDNPNQIGRWAPGVIKVDSIIYVFGGYTIDIGINDDFLWSWETTNILTNAPTGYPTALTSKPTISPTINPSVDANYITIQQCLNNGNNIDGGWYDITSIDIQNNLWIDKFGNNNNGQIINKTGLIYLGNYLNGESIIEGTTSTEIIFGTFNPRNHTVFNVARYAPNATTKGRIIMTDIENGLFGFHGSAESGVAYEGPGGYNNINWITNEQDKFGDLWVISSQQRSLYRGNLIDFTENNNPFGFSENANIKLSINYHTGGDPSDFQLAELLFFNKILDITEIECIEYYLNNKYGFDYSQIPTLIPTLNPTKSPTTEILAETNACFDGQKSNQSTIFNAPFDGELIGIKLIYITGGVNCVNDNRLVKWGCIDNRFYLNFIHITNGAYYPKNGNTKGFSLPGGNSPYYAECNENICGYHSYLLNNQSANDTQMIWLGPSYQITINDQFMLQYSEACCQYGTDNIGSVCAKVYFLYNEYKTINPSNNPTINPIPNPTINPITYIPSKTPTINPITYIPSKTPTINPITYIPSKTPTINPITYIPSK
eukprot:219498_1